MLETPNKNSVIKKMKSRKILSEANKKKSIFDNFYLTIFLGFIITAIFSGLYYQAYYVLGYNKFKLASEILILSIMILIVIKSIRNLDRISYNTKISKIILIDENENNLDEWNIIGKSSMIIGKNTKSRKVDIDLSKTKDEYLVSKNHAVMNYAANSWYIEDLGSAYGVGIKKLNGSFRKKLKVETPYKLEKGDIICINNVRLILK